MPIPSAKYTQGVLTCLGGKVLWILIVLCSLTCLKLNYKTLLINQGILTLQMDRVSLLGLTVLRSIVVFGLVKVIETSVEL